MVKAYNFLAAWQLFPEKCTYSKGTPPKSGNYKIETDDREHSLIITNNWVTLDNSAFFSEYRLIPDGAPHPFENQDFADTITGDITNASTMKVDFEKNGQKVLEVIKEIMPNGYLKITQDGIDANNEPFHNIEVYHKQLSVLPYASSVGSVAIRPNEEGAIKHKALLAMEQQTDMQLGQIREQIELLARQAQELRKRKELSLMIYEAKMSITPIIGQTYYLYEKNDGTHLLSLVNPKEWGGSGPFKQFVSGVKLLADHTWMEI
jgi:predicted transcriptional regulator